MCKAPRRVLNEVKKLTSDGSGSSNVNESFRIPKVRAEATLTLQECNIIEAKKKLIVLSSSPASWSSCPNCGKQWVFHGLMSHWLDHLALSSHLVQQWIPPLEIYACGEAPSRGSLPAVHQTRPNVHRFSHDSKIIIAKRFSLIGRSCLFSSMWKSIMKGTACCWWFGFCIWDGNRSPWCRRLSRLQRLQPGAWWRASFWLHAD